MSSKIVIMKIALHNLDLLFESHLNISEMERASAKMQGTTFKDFDIRFRYWIYHYEGNYT